MSSLTGVSVGVDGEVRSTLGKGDADGSHLVTAPRGVDCDGPAVENVGDAVADALRRVHVFTLREVRPGRQALVAFDLVSVSGRLGAGL